MSMKGSTDRGRDLKVDKAISSMVLELDYYSHASTWKPVLLDHRINHIASQDCLLARPQAGKCIHGTSSCEALRGDKENRLPVFQAVKQRLVSKAIHHKAEKVAEIVKENSTRIEKRQFQLSGFNSVHMGPRPVLQRRKRPQRSVYHIGSKKLMDCSVKLPQGLTIRVKVAN